ncbi:hypothetical protein Vretimale_3773 [Volvox reticuliferus]|uniref:Uncharacterized protein n=2 Tax=Volvox reticuliferus TaxID=1737510 RepID=A0A8J4DF68_9CHLO|nr:hypothetical protein Vretifemale_1405 [Volvox reticuliferus]GIL98414.1 hypothetical protein Vretimale_3773 [Volvox reticuliferus]
MDIRSQFSRAFAVRHSGPVTHLAWMPGPTPHAAPGPAPLPPLGAAGAPGSGRSSVASGAGGGGSQYPKSAKAQTRAKDRPTGRQYHEQKQGQHQPQSQQQKQKVVVGAAGGGGDDGNDAGNAGGDARNGVAGPRQLPQLQGPPPPAQTHPNLPACQTAPEAAPDLPVPPPPSEQAPPPPPPPSPPPPPPPPPPPSPPPPSSLPPSAPAPNLHPGSPSPRASSPSELKHKDSNEHPATMNALPAEEAQWVYLAGSGQDAGLVPEQGLTQSTRVSWSMARSAQRMAQKGDSGDNGGMTTGSTGVARADSVSGGSGPAQSFAVSRGPMTARGAGFRGRGGRSAMQSGPGEGGRGGGDQTRTQTTRNQTLMTPGRFEDLSTAPPLGRTCEGGQHGALAGGSVGFFAADGGCTPPPGLSGSGATMRQEETEIRDPEDPNGGPFEGRESTDGARSTATRSGLQQHRQQQQLGRAGGEGGSGKGLGDGVLTGTAATAAEAGAGLGPGPSTPSRPPSSASSSSPASTPTFFLLSCGGEGRLLRWPGPSLDPHSAEPGLGPGLSATKPVDVGAQLEVLVAEAAMVPTTAAAPAAAVASATDAAGGSKPSVSADATAEMGGISLPGNHPDVSHRHAHGNTARHHSTTNQHQQQQQQQQQQHHHHHHRNNNNNNSGSGGGGLGLAVSAMAVHTRRGWLAVAVSRGRGDGGGASLLVVRHHHQQQLGAVPAGGVGGRGGSTWRLVAAGSAAGGQDSRMLLWAEEDCNDGAGDDEVGGVAASGDAGSVVLGALYGKNTVAVYEIPVQPSQSDPSFRKLHQVLGFSTDSRQLVGACWLGRRYLALGADDGSVVLWAVRLPADVGGGVRAPSGAREVSGRWSSAGRAAFPLPDAAEAEAARDCEPARALRIWTLAPSGHHGHHDSITAITAVQMSLPGQPDQGNMHWVRRHQHKQDGGPLWLLFSGGRDQSVRCCRFEAWQLLAWEFDAVRRRAESSVADEEETDGGSRGNKTVRQPAMPAAAAAAAAQPLQQQQQQQQQQHEEALVAAGPSTEPVSGPPRTVNAREADGGSGGGGGGPATSPATTGDLQSTAERSELVPSSPEGTSLEPPPGVPLPLEAALATGASSLAASHALPYPGASPAPQPRLIGPSPASRVRRGRRPPAAGLRPLMPDLADLDRPEVAAAAHSLILKLAEAMYPSHTPAGALIPSAGPGSAPVVVPVGLAVAASGADAGVALGRSDVGGEGRDTALDPHHQVKGAANAEGAATVGSPLATGENEALLAHLLNDIGAARRLQVQGPGDWAAQEGAQRGGAGGGLPAELRFVTAMWEGDVGGALALAAGTEGMMSADVVAMAAAGGRSMWEAASRLYAARMEAAGCATEAALALAAVGDMAAAAGVFERAGMEWEAQQVRSAI